MQNLEASEPSRPETDLALQRYRVLTWLGRGGMSEVFLARWEHATGMHRLAVMKRLNAELCHDPITVEVFLDQARLGLGLNHPNIVQTHDVGNFEGRPCILVEYLKGQPLHLLASRVHESGRLLPLKLLVKIVVDVLEGLAAAHEATDYDGTPLGVAHRGISPQNLFIGYDGRVKVLDFGIAKAAIHESKTRSGLVEGEFAYMAPEQVRAESVDHRADLWSVGVVLWELLTGARLFKGETQAALLQAILTGSIPYTAAYRSDDVPPAIENVAQKALERDRTRRYDSAREMKAELESWLGGTGAGLTESLALYMAQRFAAERDEQQNFLRDLLAQGDAPPASSRTVARIKPARSSGSPQRSRVSEPPQVQKKETEPPLRHGITRKNGLMLWALLGSLALLTGVAAGVLIAVLRPAMRADAGSLHEALLGPARAVGSGKSEGPEPTRPPASKVAPATPPEAEPVEPEGDETAKARPESKYRASDR